MSDIKKKKQKKVYQNEKKKKVNQKNLKRILREIKKLLKHKKNQNPMVVGSLPPIPFGIGGGGSRSVGYLGVPAIGVACKSLVSRTLRLALLL